MYGEPKFDTNAYAATSMPGSSAAPATGGVAYIGPDPAVDRLKKCRAKNDECMGWRVPNTHYCQGHHQAIERGTYTEERELGEPPTDA
jgi:hypothetical protein